MKLALLTPALAPDLHDLAIMMQSDRVVLLDTMKFSRKSRLHRAKIRTPEGFQWINIPVKTEDRDKLLPEVRIDHSEDWITIILRALRFNYRNSIYFDFYEPEITADFSKARDFTRLLDFNNYFRNRLFTYLYIEPKAEWASEIPEFNTNPDLFAQNLKANIVCQEHDSRHYLRQARDKMEIEFEHPVYHQHFKGFVPYCSLLDVLFQFGPTAFHLLDTLNSHNRG